MVLEVHLHNLDAKAKHYSMWDRNKGIFNIQYLVSILRSMGHKIDFFKRYKAYEPMTKVINNIRVLILLNNDVNFDFDHEMKIKTKRK